MVDAPGAIHPIVTRGINRQRIFKDSTERINFPYRRVTILSETQTGSIPREKLRISQPVVSRAVRRGEQLAHRNRYSLKDLAQLII
jgi:hypothetical protein